MNLALAVIIAAVIITFGPVLLFAALYGGLYATVAAIDVYERLRGVVL